MMYFERSSHSIGQMSAAADILGRLIWEHYPGLGVWGRCAGERMSYTFVAKLGTRGPFTNMQVDPSLFTP